MHGKVSHKKCFSEQFKQSGGKYGGEKVIAGALSRQNSTNSSEPAKTEAPASKKKEEEEKPKEPDITEFIPEATLLIRLTTPPVDIFSKYLNFIMNFLTVTSLCLTDFTVKMPVTARLFEIEDLIKEKHGGAVGAIKLCLDTF